MYMKLSKYYEAVCEDARSIRIMADDLIISASDVGKHNSILYQVFYRAALILILTDSSKVLK